MKGKRKLETTLMQNYFEGGLFGESVRQEDNSKEEFFFSH
jgi:hypothetical protein